MASEAVDYTQNALGEPLVWILVLHYQGAEHARVCLQSLQSLTYHNFKVLLLDNGSPDQSGDDLAREFPQYDYVRLSENHGFAGGCNTGVRYCVERGAQWVWLLNNDTTVEPDTLSKLVAAGTADSKASAVGARIFTPADSGHVPEGMGEIDFRRGKTLTRRQPEPGAQAVSCEWLSGCNLLVRCDVFQSLGGFDERYFLYFEDTDLCYRMRQAGWKCLMVPDARIFHVGGASTEGRRSTWRMYYYTRNRLLFFLSHLKGAKALPPVLAISAHLLRHTLVLPFRGEKGRRQLKAELLGLNDFVRHRLGKAECLDW